MVSGESLYGADVSIDLLSFAMFSYIYRTTKLGNDVRRTALIGGSCMQAMLVFLGLSL